MGINITQTLPTKPNTASSSRTAADSDKSRVLAPAVPEAVETATENAGPQIDPARLAEVVGRANAAAEMFSAENRGVNFSVNEETQHVVVRVVDEDEERVVRQFPPDEFLKMADRLQDLRNVIFDSVA